MLHISLSPNLEKDDLLLSLRILFTPHRWLKGDALQTLEKEVSNYFEGTFVRLTNSGRSALYVILKGCGISKGDEVIIQSFSCSAVANPVLWVGATPVYIDIEQETYNLNADLLEKKISPRTKAVVVQHTFGVVADLQKIQAICKKYKILLIEDLAHALGATYKGKKAGIIGDVALVSFGRDKVISSVYGGAIVAKKHQDAIQRVYEDLRLPSRRWVGAQLLHPVLTKICLTTYRFGGDKALWALQKLHLLSRAVTKQEARGECPSYFPKKMPNALASIASHQFKKVNRFNRHRIRMAKRYHEALQHNTSVVAPAVKDGDIFLRYTIRHNESQKIFSQAIKRGIVLGDWYVNPIHPPPVSLKKMNYNKQDNPIAERLSKRVINLPTHIHTTKRDVDTLITIINNI